MGHSDKKEVFVTAKSRNISVVQAKSVPSNFDLERERLI